MVEEEVYASWVPIGAPLDNVQREEPLRQFDNSVNAVSFGFVATAILISMFLIMAIFERFLRPTSPSGGRNHRDLESQMGFNAKLGHPSPKVSNPLPMSFFKKEKFNFWVFFTLHFRLQLCSFISAMFDFSKKCLKFYCFWFLILRSSIGPNREMQNALSF